MFCPILYKSVRKWLPSLTNCSSLLHLKNCDSVSCVIRRSQLDILCSFKRQQYREQIIGKVTYPCLTPSLAVKQSNSDKMISANRMLFLWFSKLCKVCLVSCKKMMSKIFFSTNREYLSEGEKKSVMSLDILSVIKNWEVGPRVITLLYQWKYSVMILSGEQYRTDLVKFSILMHAI